MCAFQRNQFGEDWCIYRWLGHTGAHPWTDFCPCQGHSSLFIFLMYVPGPKHQEAAGKVAESYDTFWRSASVHRDFNSCDLPMLHQYIDCPTRHAKILDWWFGDIYMPRALCHVSLGKSDRSVNNNNTNHNDSADFDIFTDTTDHSILSEPEVAASLAWINPSKAPGRWFEGGSLSLLNGHSFSKIWRL